MDVLRTMDVIGSALTAERARINTISSNLANANTAKTAEGAGPYRRRDVVLESVPLTNEFGEILDENQEKTQVAVRVADVVEDQNPPRMVYDPQHPEANPEGYVAMPNVNPVSEMANMISADRAYQANINVFQTTKNMALKALELSK